MYEPKLPIFIVNNEDENIIIASSLGFAEGRMEPTEVEEGYFVVLDAAGRKANLRIDRWAVSVESWSDYGDLPELLSRIAKFLSYHSLVFGDALDDEDYISKASRLISIENYSVNWPRKPRWLRRLIHGAEPK